MLSWQHQITFTALLALAFANNAIADIDPLNLSASTEISDLMQRKAPKLLNTMKSARELTVIIELRKPKPTERSKDALRATKARLLPSLDPNKRLHKALPNFTLAAVKVRNNQGLTELLLNADVVAVYPDFSLQYHLNESLPIINQEAASSTGSDGTGYTIAVLDSGVDYSHSDFGNCDSPGAPASCRVSVSIDIASDDGALDSHGHGTNVAAIAARIAPGSSIASLDISDGDNIFVSDVLAGLDWAIENQSQYNIIAVNLSLGTDTAFSSPCDSNNPFISAIADVKAAGIAVIASAGNNANSDGISLPGCTPGVISVGAVYDANLGGLNWGVCHDASSSADQVTCFSNSASYLSLLAPGAMITAGGQIFGGTSQAAPHVSGAMALLKHRWPSASLSELEHNLLLSATEVTDPRNGLITPRLDLRSALEITETGPETRVIPFLPLWAFLLLLGCLSGIALKRR
ncbi:MAG: S8 family serine peptidase [Pseudomonadales bacterium]|nr:S8 family serine peptidase [Pseudomonadales bacterium]